MLAELCSRLSRAVFLLWRPRATYGNSTGNNCFHSRGVLSNKHAILFLQGECESGYMFKRFIAPAFARSHTISPPSPRRRMCIFCRGAGRPRTVAQMAATAPSHSQEVTSSKRAIPVPEEMRVECIRSGVFARSACKLCSLRARDTASSAFLAVSPEGYTLAQKAGNNNNSSYCFHNQARMYII